MSIFKECPICGSKAILKDTEEFRGQILRVFECRNGHRFKVKENEEVLDRMPEWAKMLQEEMES